MWNDRRHITQLTAVQHSRWGFNKVIMLLLLVVSTCGASFKFYSYGVKLADLAASDVLQQTFHDSQGRIVYLEWREYDVVSLRRVELNGTTATLATKLPRCSYLAEGPAQELYLSLYEVHKIAKLDAELQMTDFAGNGTVGHADGVSGTFTTPMGIIYFALHDALYVAEDGAVRKIIVSTQVVSTVVTNARYLASGRHLTITRNGTYIYAGSYYVTRIDVATGAVFGLRQANL